MPRNDPTDTGGLFIGRRPGTAPLRYKADPARAGERRRRTDATLAAAVLALETLVCLTLWGPSRSPGCGSARRSTTTGRGSPWPWP